MSTLANPAQVFPSRTRTDRRFYLSVALAAALVIFIGFARSYYLKAYFPSAPAIRLLVHIHGFVFSLWMVYFVAQTALIAVRRPALHRKLGYTGAVLGSLVIALGLVVSFSGMRLGHGTTFITPEVTFLVGLIDICTFGLFFLVGWIWRRDREVHQRAMLLAVIGGLLGAAIGRMVGYGVSIPVASIGNLAFIFAGPVYDFATRRRVHPVYVYGCLLLLVTFTPFRFAVGSTPTWHRIAHRLAGR